MAMMFVFVIMDRVRS